MEVVTAHLKSVLKNYQHSAPKSLQGPGAGGGGGGVAALERAPSPTAGAGATLEVVTRATQRPPILTAADTSRGERTETWLEGESISCFVVGGERRLCLPQVLNSVLRDFSLHQINQECDALQIYCSRCTPAQLAELKSSGILPHGAPSCGLITHTDAERLCAALLHHGTRPATTVQVTAPSAPPPPPPGAVSFRVYHQCFGKCAGRCVPALAARAPPRCIQCVECHAWFTPSQFVCHAHRRLENRTCHWGFDSRNWRAYLHVYRDQPDHEHCSRLLDALKQQLDAADLHTNHKRKQMQMMEAELCKAEPDMPPLKKAKLDEYTAYLYAAGALDPLYLHAAMYEQWSSRQMSAFRPVGSAGKAARHAALGPPKYKDPPVLQHPERVVPLSESERFERSFQPNVALAPRNLKYEVEEEEEIQREASGVPQTVVASVPPPAAPAPVSTPAPVPAVAGSPGTVDSTVSSVVRPARYSSEIELSTDTDDSLSDASSERVSPVQRVAEALANAPAATRDTVLDLVRHIALEHGHALQQCRDKDQRIRQLEQQLAALRRARDATAAAAAVASQSEYDVSSSRAEDDMPRPDDSPAATTGPDVSSCLPAIDDDVSPAPPTPPPLAESPPDCVPQPPPPASPSPDDTCVEERPIDPDPAPELTTVTSAATSVIAVSGRVPDETSGEVSPPASAQ